MKDKSDFDCLDLNEGEEFLSFVTSSQISHTVHLSVLLCRTNDDQSQEILLRSYQYEKLFLYRDQESVKNDKASKVFDLKINLDKDEHREVFGIDSMSFDKGESLNYPTSVHRVYRDSIPGHSAKPHQALIV